MTGIRTPRRVPARLTSLVRRAGRATSHALGRLLYVACAPARLTWRLVRWVVRRVVAFLAACRDAVARLAGGVARAVRAAVGAVVGGVVGAARWVWRGVTGTTARCWRGVTGTAARCWRAVRRVAARTGRTLAVPLRPLDRRRARNRQQRLAVRSRRLEVAAVVAVATLCLAAGILGPAGGDSATDVREARSSSMIAAGVSRPGAVDAPAAPPNAGSTANLDPLAWGQPATVVAAPLPRSAPTRVRVPQLGTDAEVIAADLSPDGGPPTPSEEDAQRAAWYAGGVAPGEIGAAILVGHLDTYDGPAAFAGLGQLRPGETIEIDRADGQTAVFVVDSVEQYPKSAFPDERVYGATNSAQLRLITCGGRWTSDGGYDSNIVAYAHLTPSLR